MIPHPPKPTSRAFAFTLMELLVVIAIMSIIALLVMPAVTQMSRTMALTQAGQATADTLSYARQIATTKNRRIEVRFYQLPSLTDPSQKVYRALQVFAIEPAGLQPLGKVVKLPDSVVISTEASVSTLPQLTGTASDSTEWNPNGIGTISQWFSFNFLPSGETDLNPSGNWYFTLVLEKDRAGTNGLPANYVVTWIDPASGKIGVFRP